MTCLRFLFHGSQRRTGPLGPHGRRLGTTTLMWSFLALVTLPSSTLARDWWVAPGRGTDFAEGTVNRPLNTISHAIWRASAGDTFIIRGGFYRVSHSQSSYIWKSGAPNAWMTIRPAAGEEVVFSSTDDSPCIGTNKDYVEIRGITCTGRTGIRADGKHLRIIGNRIVDVTGPGGAGIAGGRNTEDVLIFGNTIERVRSAGIHMGSNRRGSTRNITIRSNTVRDSGRGWMNSNATGGWSAGIAIVGGQGGLIENNLVERTYGEGIACSLGDQCRILKNVVWDAFNALYHGDNLTNSVWDGNVGWTSGNGNFARNYGQGSELAGGVLLGNESGWYQGAGNPTSGNIVCNNVFTNVEHGINLANFYDGDTGGVSNTLIANNTFSSVRQCGIHISSDLRLWSNRFANNIVVPGPGAKPTCVFANGVSYDHNLWASGDPGVGAGAGDVRAMPQFTGRGTTPRQYALKASSPGVDRGATIDAVTTDIVRRRRFQGAAYDMGAFEVR